MANAPCADDVSPMYAPAARSQRRPGRAPRARAALAPRSEINALILRGFRSNFVVGGIVRAIPPQSRTRAAQEHNPPLFPAQAGIQMTGTRAESRARTGSSETRKRFMIRVPAFAGMSG